MPILFKSDTVKWFYSYCQLWRSLTRWTS